VIAGLVCTGHFSGVISFLAVRFRNNLLPAVREFTIGGVVVVSVEIRRCKMAPEECGEWLLRSVSGPKHLFVLNLTVHRWRPEAFGVVEYLATQCRVG
jgi:hypothetical protein